MRVAFKEWAVVADALGRGDQILILRKGGLREGRGGFQVEHGQFLLFPTLYHQQRESVLPAAQARYDLLAPGFPGPDRVRFEYWAEVADWRRLESLGDVEKLRGQHIWRDEVIAERFDWGKDQHIHVLAARVYRLPAPVEMAILPAHGGCKSWIELEQDMATEPACPALDDEAFARTLARFRQALRTE